MLRPSSHADQAADHLRDEIMRGRWVEVMPGRTPLARELGINWKTVESALAQLENEGLIQSQGPGKPRRITGTSNQKSVGGTHVTMVLYETQGGLNTAVGDIQHQLRAAGHPVFFSAKTSSEVKHDPDQVESMVRKLGAEACILVAAGREVLQRFEAFPIPTFALFGKMSGLKISGTGPDKIQAIRDSITSLCANGHQRIVMLKHREALHAEHGISERTFLEELENRGLSHGEYNLPRWENTPEGLRHCLIRLFQVTPPTAILVDDLMLLYAIQSFLVRKRGNIFRQVTLVAMDPHPIFGWCQPGVPHFYWDISKVVSHTVKWVNDVARRKNDREQKRIECKFVDAGGVTKVGHPQSN